VLWATWSSWRYPCLRQGRWARWPLKVPSNTDYSIILWFYDSARNQWEGHRHMTILWLTDQWIRRIDHKSSKESLCWLQDGFKWCRKAFENTSSQMLFLLLLYPSSTWDDNAESYPLLYCKPCDICVFFLVAWCMEDKICINKTPSSHILNRLLNTKMPCLLKKSLRQWGCDPILYSPFFTSAPGLWKCLLM